MQRPVTIKPVTTKDAAALKSSLETAAPLAVLPLPWRAGTAVLGVALMSASSWVDVPMYPVPMTLQTLAVLVIAGLCGGGLGGLIVAAWLVVGAAGAPVYAGGESGVDALAGPTGGYLGGMLLAAVVCGRLMDRARWRGWGRMLGVCALGHALVLGVGWARLAQMIGAGEAWSTGVAPFLVGAAVKTVAAVAIIKLAERLLRRPASAAGET
jgi:biotin transport system substrate-specific component